MYDIEFLDERSIQIELQQTLIDSVDCINEARKAVLRAAYATKDRRKLSNKLFNEDKRIHVQEDDLLWAYFSPEITKNSQTQFRSFYVRQIISQKDKMILFVRFTYEKEKNWFDLQIR